MKPRTRFLIIIAALTCLTVSEVHAQVICVRDPNTGKWINPSPEKAPDCIKPSYTPPPPNSTPPASGVIQVLESSGEVSFIPAEGWLEENTAQHPPGPIPNALTAGSKVELGSVVRTGRTGHLNVSLPAGHTLEAGPNTEFLIERYVRRIESLLNNVKIKLYQGRIRMKRLMPWEHRTCSPEGCRIWVESSQSIQTVRGTDVEFFFGADTAGYIKLYSGSVSVLPYDSDNEIFLKPGEMVTFKSDGSMTGPFRIPDE